jgi:hypothetical protein
MELSEIVKLLTDNGIGLVCLGFILVEHYHYSKTLEVSMKEQTDTLKEVSDTLIKMNERINNLELCRRESEK